MRLIEQTAYLAHGAGAPSQSRAFGSARALGSSRDRFDAGPVPAVILTRVQATGGLPFLAQYLAQEIIGPETLPQWRERDVAYRLAETPVDPARLTLDI